jgi:hypothetical protein
MPPLEKPDLVPTPPHLRLVEETAPLPAPEGAYTTLLVALSASAGHGLFLVTALTRLRSLPSRAELGGLVESAVLAWFVLALPLVAGALLARRRFLALAPRRAAQLSGVVVLASALAFVFYLRAVAL